MISTTMSENVADFVTALAKFQGAITPPPKLRTVEVATRDGRKYSFKYAELDVILEHIKAPFSANGFAWTSWIDPNGPRPILTTRVYHTSGQWMQTTAHLTASSDPKQLAGEITYWRRYSFCMLLGIASQEDADETPPPGSQTKGRTHAPGSNASNSSDRAPKVRPKTPPAEGVPGTSPGAGAPPAAGTAPGAQPGSGMGSGTLNSNPLKPGQAAGMSVVGTAERQHVDNLAKEKGWSRENVIEYIRRRYDALKLVDLFMPQYQDLVAVIGSTGFEQAIGELGALPEEVSGA